MAALIKAPQRIFYGWWIVLAFATLSMISGGTFYYGFSAIFNPILHEFGWSVTVTALAFSLRSETAAIGAPIAGFLADRIGARPVMILGVAMVILGLVWLGNIDGLWGFYASFSLISLGNSFSNTWLGMIVLARWFSRRRTMAMSVLTMGAGFSGLSVPVVAWVVATQGWRPAVLFTAVAVLVVSVPIALIIRERPEPYGLTPDGLPLDSTRANSAADARPTATATDQSPSYTVRDATKNRGFWHMVVALSLSTCGSTAVVVMLIPALTQVGLGFETAALVAAGVPLFSLIGRLGGGLGGDRVDKRRLLALLFLLQALGTLVLAFATTPWLALLFLLFYAPGFGGTLPLRPALQAEQFGIESMGSIQGLMLVIITAGGFFGPLFVGALVDLTGQYMLGFLGLAVAVALAVPLMLTMPTRRSP